MKHFFFPHEATPNQDGILNRLFIHNIKEDSTYDDQLKVFYDAADIICDKRFEEEDGELKTLVERGGKGESGNNTVVPFYEKLVPYKSDNRDKKYYRIKALKMLWRYIEENNAVIFCETQNDGEEWKESISRVLYHLTRGNICLRISQCYYESYDLEKSDIWGNRAIEILWHGKNLAARLRDSSTAQKRMVADLYLRLTKLNLAKYYRDYARKNRRSDFDASLDEFKQVRKRVEDEIEHVSAEEEMKRQYVLIWMDAVFNIANIHRRKYQADITRREVLFSYHCLKQGDGEFFKLIECADKLVESEGEDIEKLLDHPQIKEDLPDLCADSFKKCAALHDYDRKRYFLLILIEISRIYRDLHFKENYLRAMATAVIADRWSYHLDNSAGCGGNNIDALITISSSLRKYIKYRDTGRCEDVLPEKIEIMVNGTTQSLHLRDEGGTEEKETATLGEFIMKLIKFAENGHLKSKTEIIKWHCLYLQKPKVLKSVQGMVGDYGKIEKYFKVENQNLQILFLEGLVMLRMKKYKRALKIFEKLVDPRNKETQYVRLGTIGLKARYLLADCYMSLAEFSKAEKILKELQDTLAFAKKSGIGQGMPGRTDSDIDDRTEIDLGYCYMQRGEYGKAIEIYRGMFGDGQEGKNGSEFHLPKIKKERQIMGLNNYAACCILSVDDMDEGESSCEKDGEKENIVSKNDKKEKKLIVNEKLETARKIFCYMGQRSGEDKVWCESNPETNLLKGYYTLCAGVKPGDVPVTENEKERLENTRKREQTYVDAHEYFRKACRFEDAFTSRYNLLDEKGKGNMAKYRNEVERISVYIINLTNLYTLYLKNKKEIETGTYKTNGETIELRDDLKVTKEQLKYLSDSRLNLERFILNFPTTYKISLKASIALAEWLLEYEKNYHTKSDGLIKQLYRSFSYVTIYEERGAHVFNILKDNPKFRLFTASDRGKFLALLLAMYKPIKAIKEVCCFKSIDKRNHPNLVHYTSIECLKKILTDGQKKEKPHFRINNCGYMNDVFEGTVFLKSIAMVSGEITSKEKEGHSALIKEYFPQLNRSNENMLPSGSNVYIGSLSVKKDSFPMWSVYAANEKGCNIEFGNGFFDIDGNPCLPKALRGYMLSKYTDQDYPLYA